MTTGMGTLSLLQQIFPAQESNWGLLHCRWILYQLSHQGSPHILLNPSFYIANREKLQGETCEECCKGESQIQDIINIQSKDNKCKMQLTQGQGAEKQTQLQTTHQEWAPEVAIVVKYPPATAGDARDAGSIPGSRRSPGGGHGNPLQYPCLENPTDRGAGGLQSMDS